jgi:hypothetical protein
MEPDQVHLVPTAVSRDSQQVIHTLEPRFTGQIGRDVGDSNRRNRIHDDVALVHPVTTTHLYMRTRPDANAASDSAAPDSLAKAFGEHHMKPHPMATDRRQCRPGHGSCRPGTRLSAIILTMEAARLSGAVRCRHGPCADHYGVTRYLYDSLGRNRRSARLIDVEPRCPHGHSALSRVSCRHAETSRINSRS